MRKKTCKNLFDNIMWYLIYLLPIIAVLIAMGNEVLMTHIYDDSGYTATAFFPMLKDTLWDFGIYPEEYPAMQFIQTFEIVGLYAEPLAMYLAYFIVCYLGHLMVDFLLFIPRLCHKWMNEFTQGD